MAGIIGAVFNSGIELGSAVGIAVDASVETGIENNNGPDGFDHWKGRQATFWWLLAATSAVALSVLIFYRTSSQLAQSGVAPSSSSAASDSDTDAPQCETVVVEMKKEPLDLPSAENSGKNSLSSQTPRSGSPTIEEKLEV